MIGCMGKVAWERKFISNDKFKAVISKYGKSKYRDYLSQI